MKLEISNATCGYGPHEILKGVNLSVESGQIVCLLGKNGSGKTTLFKSMLNLLPLLEGEILIDGKDTRKIGRREFARRIAYVPQARSLPFTFTVLDVVLFGRTAYLSTFASPGKKDRMIAEEVLEQLQISHLRNRVFTHLSGGEQQMVIIARALAQQPSFLMMDEPTSNLDFGNQIQVISRICRLKSDSLGIIMSTHSPDHAFMSDADVVVVHDGKIWKNGPCHEVLSEEALKMVYGIDVKIASVDGGREVCIPYMTGKSFCDQNQRSIEQELINTNK